MTESTWGTREIALVQTASSLDPAANRERLESLAPSGADLVVFPEAFQCDFGSPSDNLSARAEGLDGPFATELRRVAGLREAAVVAGMFESWGEDDAGPPYNTLVLSNRGAGVAIYRKIHLYDSFGYRESERLSPGPLGPAVIDLDGLRVGLMTCYDLRFPELARALVAAGAELLVIPAAWVAGEGKVDHWRTLVRARAIENTVYVAACGQPAPRYSGHSLIVDPLGVVLADAGDGEDVVRASISRERLDEVRAINPSLRNRRM